MELILVSCVALFYDEIWTYFDRFVLTLVHVWVLNFHVSISRELSKNRKTLAGKKAKSKRRCMNNRDINECNCEQLRMDFSELRAKYQHEHLKSCDDYRARYGAKDTSDLSLRVFIEFE
jgi:hypothetical protein